MSKLISEVKSSYAELSDSEKENFLERISIFDNSPRITNIDNLISDKHFKTIRRENRSAVLERLLGWWQDVTINQIAGESGSPIFGYTVSDKLASIAEEYRSDNLPITFRGAQPQGAIDPDNDNRLFVKQLKALDVSTERIEFAIIDYYRAFEQRSSWARENLLVSGEMEEYEDRLVEEWSRYRLVVLESLSKAKSEEELINKGREILRWAENQTGHLRLREQVTEAYVVRGAFHILANHSPIPKVYWHPEFVARLKFVLEQVS